MEFEFYVVYFFFGMIALSSFGSFSRHWNNCWVNYWLLLDLQTLLKCVAWSPMFGRPHPPAVLLWEFDVQPWASGADVAS